MLFIFVCILLTGCSLISQQKFEELDMISYETINYTKLSYRGEFYAASLCVTNDDVVKTTFVPSENVGKMGLFDLNKKEVLHAKDIHNTLYPASTTKVMTALVALEYGNLDDMVTVSRTAAAASFNPGEQVCGLKEGEQVSLIDLLNGLILYSGNDTAMAIAEHISGGDVRQFYELMNQKAKDLLATNTYFVNPHGLHDDDQYTTVYDLYLIFNEAIQNELFLEIIGKSSHMMQLTDAVGNTRKIECKPTNYYSLGEVAQPSVARVVGGKTGTTREAGSCVILYEVDAENNPYISIIMGASTKQRLYSQMTNLIDSIATPIEQ